MKANSLDLTLFQFDYDLTFAVFFMNADQTIYGRYGTRSSVPEATRDMSVGGLAAAMSAALKIHEGYPGNRESLKGKQAVATEYQTPDDFPSLQGKFTESLDYDVAVTKSCLHCHQIRDAHREVYREAGKPIPDRLLFPNPLPSVIGLEFDPGARATVRRVANQSPAQRAGFEEGDELVTLDGQPIVSLADTQWVLHNAGSSDAMNAVILRNGARRSLELKLEPGWRRKTDISWRVSSWPLRRMGTGGLKFKEATAAQRKEASLAEDALALSVEHVGQYGAHGVAKRAGFQKEDLVVTFDGQDKHMTISQLLAYAAQNTKPGQRIPVVVVRKGQRMTLELLMQ